MMGHCAAFIPPLHPTLPPALKWFFIIVAKTSLLSDPGARGDAKPPSPICKHVRVHPSELGGEKIWHPLLQLVVRGLFSV